MTEARTASIRLGTSILGFSLAYCLSACVHSHSSSPLPPSPPPTPTNSCGLNSADEVKAAIDKDMHDIADLYGEAVSCAKQSQCPSGMDYFSCFEIRKGYGTWLEFVSRGLQTASDSPPPAQSGEMSYEDAAKAAQGMNEFVSACQTPPAFPPGAVQHRPADNCGKDVDCQRAELQKQQFAEACAKDPNYSPNCPQQVPSPFLHVGNQLLKRFQGCSGTTGQQASQYLLSKYSW